MSTTITPNGGFSVPVIGDITWGVDQNAGIFNYLDGFSPVTGLCIYNPTGPGGTGTSVNMGPGSFVNQDGSVVAKTLQTGFALTVSQTNYLYLDGTASWALTKSTSGFPATVHVRLAVIVVGSSTITSITDARWTVNVVGPWYDGSTITLGTTTGLVLGTNSPSGQKLGFLGATPVIQQPAGADPVTLLNTFGLKAAEGTPSVTGGAAAGTSPTVTLVSGSRDRRGVVQVVTGSSPGASATIVTITFSTGLGAAPKAVLFSPANANAAAAAGVFASSANMISGAGASVTLDATSALTAATTYQWHYSVEG